jgi:hypothetical protein
MADRSDVPWVVPTVSWTAVMMVAATASHSVDVMVVYWVGKWVCE